MFWVIDGRDTKLKLLKPEYPNSSLAANLQFLNLSFH